MRGPANALSTASNWIFNFLGKSGPLNVLDLPHVAVVVMIVGPSFQNINWGTYIGMVFVTLHLRLLIIFLVFASLNAMIVPIVYLFFPETAGRSLEGAHLHNLSPISV